MLSTSVDDEVIEVQSQAYDQGAKLERHEEGDEGGQAEGLQEGEDCLEIR